MSGGKFEYGQSSILDIIETIESYIEKNGKEKTQEEIDEDGWLDPDWYERYPEDKFHYKYDEDIINEFKNGVQALKKAYIYAHRIDYLLSGDDGEESFKERLNQELSDLDK